ncbi:MAG: fused MFS/spermidine synthase [Deltaproteobacteria bacterium]|jgi:spermidine synthase|nr:fused MFS/spermidine synthase [Deltaproteobacteria bacterium]
MKSKTAGVIRGLLNSIRAGFPRAGPEIIFEGDSEHNHITVLEHGDVRTMCFGPLAEESETSISLSNPLAPIFEYPGLMFMALVTGGRNREILMLGLGGGFIPRLFQEFLPEHNLTVVEIDPLVGEIASTYFYFQPGKNVELIYADGEEYLASLTPGRFDQIWLDAFNGNYIPPNLATDDFLQLCRNALPANGVLAQNLHQTRLASFRQQIRRTARFFGAVPLIFNGTRCANSVSLSYNIPETYNPTVKELVNLVKNFQTSVGPYNLLEEAKKKEKNPGFYL